MGLVIIGGMLISTVVALFIVPVLDLLLTRRQGSTQPILFCSHTTRYPNYWHANFRWLCDRVPLSRKPVIS